MQIGSAVGPIQVIGGLTTKCLSLADQSNEKEKKNVPSLAMRLLFIASLLLFLLATAAEYYRTPEVGGIEPPPTESSAQDTLIVPGTRIGPVTLGLSSKHLTEVLGSGQLRPHQKGIVHLYEEFALAVYTENNRVVSVTTRSPVFKTKTGVGVGSDIDLVLKSLGRDYEMSGEGESYVLHNWNRGWHVGVEKEKVTYFQVTPELEDAP